MVDDIKPVEETCVVDKYDMRLIHHFTFRPRQKVIVLDYAGKQWHGIITGRKLQAEEFPEKDDYKADLVEVYDVLVLDDSLPDKHQQCEFFATDLMPERICQEQVTPKDSSCQ